MKLAQLDERLKNKFDEHEDREAREHKRKMDEIEEQLKRKERELYEIDIKPRRLENRRCPSVDNMAIKKQASDGRRKIAQIKEIYLEERGQRRYDSASKAERKVMTKRQVSAKELNDARKEAFEERMAL